MASMDSPFSEKIQANLAQLQSLEGEVSRIRQSIADKTVACTSPDRAIAVTVGGLGDVQKVEFATTAYQFMSPTDLGRTIVETIAKARKQMTDQVMEEVAPILQRDSLLGDEMLHETPLGPILAPLKDALNQDSPSSLRNWLER
jgi:DNA-binding protein YbaB